MTFELALPAFLAGIALGLRYRVVILIPAVALVILFAMIVGIARGDGLLSLIMAMVIPGAAIQIGYLAGAHIRTTVDDHLIKAFAPKAQACECEATGDNANGDGERVTRQPSTNHPADGHAGEQPENPDCQLEASI